MYDFRFCKLCGAREAAPRYPLRGARLYRCPHCDFHYLDVLDQLPAEPPDTPHPPLLSRERAFIASKLPENSRLQHKRLTFVRRHLELAHCRLLDIGAGAGCFLHLAAAAGACPAGIEPNPQLRTFAREEYRLDLAAELLDAPRWLRDHEETFEAATLWDVIEHVDFPVPLLERTYQLLRPGGMLFLDTPSRDTLTYRLGTLLTRLGGENAPLGLNAFYAATRCGHKQIFRPAQLTLLLERIGFDIVTQASGYERHGLPRLVSALTPQDKIVLACRKPLTAAPSPHTPQRKCQP